MSAGAQEQQRPPVDDTGIVTAVVVHAMGGRDIGVARGLASDGEGVELRTPASGFPFPAPGRS